MDFENSQSGSQICLRTYMSKMGVHEARLKRTNYSVSLIEIELEGSAYFLEPRYPELDGDVFAFQRIERT